jgi:hypothetical protein
VPQTSRALFSTWNRLDKMVQLVIYLELNLKTSS